MHETVNKLQSIAKRMRHDAKMRHQDGERLAAQAAAYEEAAQILKHDMHRGIDNIGDQVAEADGCSKPATLREY